MASALERMARATARRHGGEGVDAAAIALAKTPLSRRRLLGFGGAIIAWRVLGARSAKVPFATVSCAEGTECGSGLCHGPGPYFCDPPCKNGLTGDTPKFCPDPDGGHCCGSGTACCSSSYYSEPCCAPGYDCCEGFLCCLPGQTCCLGEEPVSADGLRGGQCCFEKGATCSGTGACVAPCPGLRKCYEPGTVWTGLCCDEGADCCPAGAPSSTERICCPVSWECARQILPGDLGATAGSPNTCCPPEQLVTATSEHLCCPAGSVHLPGGAVFTADGFFFCCTKEKLCGTSCCESLPRFPKYCKDENCVFDLAKIYPTRARAGTSGQVPVPVSFSGPASGTLSLQTAGSGPSPQMVGVALVKKPTVLGSAHFQVPRPGTVDVIVYLSGTARQQLKRARTLSVQAVITFTEDGKSASTSVPFKLES